MVAGCWWLAACSVTSVRANMPRKCRQPSSLLFARSPSRGAVAGTTTQLLSSDSENGLNGGGAGCLKGEDLLFSFGCRQPRCSLEAPSRGAVVGDNDPTKWGNAVNGSAKAQRVLSSAAADRLRLGAGVALDVNENGLSTSSAIQALSESVIVWWELSAVPR